jgi:hypothetical protein
MAADAVDFHICHFSFILILLIRLGGQLNAIGKSNQTKLNHI